jgi:hypothetical protein
MVMASLREFIHGLITKARCVFVSHSLSEGDLIEFKKNKNQPYFAECATCKRPIMAKVHPIATHAYMVNEV